MNTPASTSLHGGWPPQLGSPLLTGLDFLQWSPVLDYAAHPSSLFSSFPSTSTSNQPVALPFEDLTMFPTLAELLVTMLNNAKPGREYQLSDEHIQIATTWICHRFKSISDISEHEFDRYIEKWRKVAENNLKANDLKASKVAQPDAKRKIPRPLNSFFFFKTVAVSSLHTGVASQLWRTLPAWSVRVWKLASQRLDQLHKDIFPEYKFNPTRDSVRRKVEIKVQSRAEFYKDTLPRGAKKRRTAEAPTTLPAGNSEPPNASNEATQWLKKVGEYCGHSFEFLGRSAEYNLGQDLHSTPFGLFPGFPLGDSNYKFDVGTSLGSTHNAHTGDAGFGEESWIREINDLLRQAS